MDRGALLVAGIARHAVGYLSFSPKVISGMLSSSQNEPNGV
ncbi:hypothetical protein [Lentilactobacillus parabuchneri]|nr:hypothetical protein [Lentilactobacillus parabuchneri]